MSVVDDFKLHLLKNIQGIYKQVLSADISKEDKNDFVTLYWKIRGLLGSFEIEGIKIERVFDESETQNIGELTNDTSTSENDEITIETQTIGELTNDTSTSENDESTIETQN